MLRHLFNIIGWAGDQPRCYYALTAAYCDLAAKLRGQQVPFKSNFVDGPWAGQSVTSDVKVPKYEVSRAGNPQAGVQDSIFVYEPAGDAKDEFGIETQEFKITYDGPASQFQSKK